MVVPTALAVAEAPAVSDAEWASAHRAPAVAGQVLGGGAGGGFRPPSARNSPSTSQSREWGGDGGGSAAGTLAEGAGARLVGVRERAVSSHRAGVDGVVQPLSFVGRG